VRVPDVVQREAKRSGAPLIRDRFKGGIWNGPGSAAHHCALPRFMLRRARDTRRLRNIKNYPLVAPAVSPAM
jgi:hypothetical protein